MVEGTVQGPEPSVGRASRSIREIVASVDDSAMEVVDVPEWGVKLEVRSMTGAERAKTFERAQNPETGTVDYAKVNPAIIIATVFDPETGEQVFGPDDEKMLNSKSAAVTERLGRIALRLSGLDEGAEARAGKASSAASGGSTST